MPLSTNAGVVSFFGSEEHHFPAGEAVEVNNLGPHWVRNGGDTWYFIRADYAAGRSLQNDATRFVEQSGGKVIGSIAMPIQPTVARPSRPIRKLPCS